MTSPGRGRRPRVPGRVRLAGAYVTEETAAWLRQHCKHLGVSMSEVQRRVLEEYRDRVERDEGSDE